MVIIKAPLLSSIEALSADLRVRAVYWWRGYGLNFRLMPLGAGDPVTKKIVLKIF